MGHSIETEVSHICLFCEDEPTEKDGSIRDDGGFGIDVDGEVDGFEEDGVLSVVVLDVLHRRQHYGQDKRKDTLAVSPATYL